MQRIGPLQTLVDWDPFDFDSLMDFRVTSLPRSVGSSRWPRIFRAVSGERTVLDQRGLTARVSRGSLDQQDGAWMEMSAALTDRDRGGQVEETLSREGAMRVDRAGKTDVPSTRYSRLLQQQQRRRQRIKEGGVSWL